MDVGQEGGHQAYVEAQKWGAFLVLNVYISQGGNKDDHRSALWILLMMKTDELTESLSASLFAISAERNDIFVGREPLDDLMM